MRVTVEKIVKKEKRVFYDMVDAAYLYTFEAFKRYIDTRIGTNHEWMMAWHDYCGYHERKEYFRHKTFMREIQEFFDTNASYKSDIYRKYSVLYYVREYEEIFVDGKPHIRLKTILLPQLKQYKFAKVIPPMQAFQEISMYLGQLDLAEDNTVQIGDKHLAQAKGFDCYSFKKMPAKRKAKRCKISR